MNDKMYFLEETSIAHMKVADCSDEDLLNEYIRRFGQRNRFEKFIDALDNTTPAEWRKQVNEAAEDLLNSFASMEQEIDQNLHCGNYTVQSYGKVG